MENTAQLKNSIFEKAQAAILTLKTITPSLSKGERETLSLLLDDKAMQTLEDSQQDFLAGRVESFDQVFEGK